MAKKNLKKVHAIIQARLDSSRLPNKILMKFGGKNSIELIHEKLKKIKSIEKIIFAIPNDKKNKYLKNYLLKKNFQFFEGNKYDVLDRYYKTAKKFNSNKIIRITSDCPLLDRKILEKNLNFYLNSNYDYMSNNIFPTYPDGYDFEFFNFKTLHKAWTNAKDKEHREHVTPFMKSNPQIFRLYNIKSKEDHSDIRVTLDDLSDYTLIKKIFKVSKKKEIFYKDLLKILKDNKFNKVNSQNIRNFGSINNNKNKKTWIKAEKLLPNGNLFFSKNPKFFSEDKWPTYFKKTKDVFIWDLENKKFLDFCHMGVGTNSLGYSNKKIDNEVSKVVKQGNLSTLNCPEEVFLADELIKIHPWAKMARFARTGGEANSIAIRIARTFTKRKKVAICGYHGWHDWYLSTNLSNRNNLNNHLSKNLNIEGVIDNLKNTVYSFEYNNYESLLKILNKNPDVGIVKLEVQRDFAPKNNFLKKIRKICNDRNLILIFDECTTGFRETPGGIHLKYKVNPDMAIFGKALGNGYAITAIIGKKEIMECSKISFISSTFWTERIGPTAALATLKEMKKAQSWKKISNFGGKIKNEISKIAKKNTIPIRFTGINSLLKFEILSKNAEFYYRFITEEMLKKKILAKNLIYVSTKHNDSHLKRYSLCLDEIFKKIKCMEKQKLILHA